MMYMLVTGDVGIEQEVADGTEEYFIASPVRHDMAERRYYETVDLVALRKHYTSLCFLRFLLFKRLPLRAFERYGRS
jgi:hypothetical protein